MIFRFFHRKQKRNQDIVSRIEAYTLAGSSVDVLRGDHGEIVAYFPQAGAR